MDIQTLTAFITVGEKSSFSEAALELGLTQSAISKRIALLEKDIQHPLFDRVSRRVELTEAGRALLPRAKSILQSIDDTARYMADLQGDIQGTLRIATSHHIGIHRLPAVLKAFTDQYPDVLLQLKFIDSEEAQAAILHGDFDLAFITLSEPILEGKIELLQHYKIWQDPMVFVANKEHALSSKKKITLSHLAQHPAILPDANTYTTQLIQKLFNQKGERLSLSMTTNHLDAIRMMTEVGLGWSILPETLIDKSLQKLNVSAKKITRELGCILHRERTISNAARAFLNTLK